MMPTNVFDELATEVAKLFPNALYTYHTKLIQEGFTPQESILLVSQLQTTMITATLDYRTQNND